MTFKNKTSHILIVLFVFIVLIGCSKENMQSIDFRSLSIRPACDGSILKSSTNKEETLIITSEQMFSKEFGCLTTAPEIDFKTHFVLAGRVAFNNCASLKEEAITEENNTLNYRVQIQQANCTALDTVYFSAALPIRYKDHQINFEIKY